MPTEKKTPPRYFCTECKREVAYAKSFNQWYHMNGMGRFCKARVITVQRY